MKVIPSSIHFFVSKTAVSTLISAVFELFSRVSSPFLRNFSLFLRKFGFLLRKFGLLLRNFSVFYVKSVSFYVISVSFYVSIVRFYAFLFRFVSGVTPKTPDNGLFSREDKSKKRVNAGFIDMLRMLRGSPKSKRGPPRLSTLLHRGSPSVPEPVWPSPA